MIVIVIMIILLFQLQLSWLNIHIEVEVYMRAAFFYCVNSEVYKEDLCFMLLMSVLLKQSIKLIIKNNNSKLTKANEGEV